MYVVAVDVYCAVRRVLKMKGVIMGNGNLKMESTGSHYMSTGIQTDEVFAPKVVEVESSDSSGLVVGNLVPFGRNLIILPYKSNPYKRVSSSGILLPEDVSFKNPDSGEMDEAKLGISWAQVIEVGKDCEVIVKGTDVCYDIRTVRPLPFLGMGYFTLHEQQVQAYVINTVE